MFYYHKRIDLVELVYVAVVEVANMVHSQYKDPDQGDD